MGNAPSTDRRSAAADNRRRRTADAKWTWELQNGRYQPVPRRQPPKQPPKPSSKQLSKPPSKPPSKPARRPLYKGFKPDNFEAFDAFHTYND